MSDIVRASLSIERDLMERFDRFVEHSGHTNRSEAVRDLIRAKLLREEWGEGADEAVASVTLLYDHSKHGLSRQIEEHGHDHHDVVLSSMHIHISSRVCLEVIVLRGRPEDIKHVANHLVGLPGVLHGQAVYSRPDLPEALR